ncbi:MAG: hypothetical protein JWN24_2878 [Phycisphaerales bacterium]|nr:hypothetical protein [Phycisphaerales bacterium]
MKVRLLTWFNGSGLSRDAQIVGDLLRSRGYAVAERNFFDPPQADRADLNLFLERASPLHFPTARPLRTSDIQNLRVALAELGH